MHDQKAGRTETKAATTERCSMSVQGATLIISRRSRRLIVATLFLIASAARAQQAEGPADKMVQELASRLEGKRWRLIYYKVSNEQGTFVTVDPRRVKRVAGPAYQVWLRTDVMPQTSLSEEEADKKYDYRVSHDTIDCAKERFKFGDVIYYRLDGSIVGEMSAFGGWQEAVPDSFGEGVVDGACKAIFKLGKK